MKADITQDGKYIQIIDPTAIELNQLRVSFTKEIPGAFVYKKTCPWATTSRAFIDEFGLIPFGLWTYLVEVCQRFNYHIDFSDELKRHTCADALDKDSFFKYVKKMFKDAKNNSGDPFMPYDYQIDAAYNILKYKNCCAEISTSGGKTLISFIIFKWLIDVAKIKKILYIVPSVDLAVQSAEKYEEYESYLAKHNHNWKIGILKSGLKKKEKAAVESCNILFGTFQSLCKKDSHFFDDFGAHIGDECHHYAGSASLKNILDKCQNLKYSIGMTGTFPKSGSYNSLMLQSIIGPVVYKFTANDLIHKEKAGTPIHIVFEIMDYARYEDKAMLFGKRLEVNLSNVSSGSKCLREEQDYVNSSELRLDHICKLAASTKNNTLILFGDIKGGYGKRIADRIKQMNSGKQVFYADGGTPEINRAYYKNAMEDNNDVVMVASIGTFGEGIDIKNLWNIFLVNTCKSERLVRQIVGRGLRSYPGKDMTVLFDFVDDLRVKDPRKGHNYMWKHYLERKKIYEEQKFPTYKHNVTLLSSGESLI